jgi:adenylosuccinate synthase
VALGRSIVNNGITGLCVTKLDVLDGLAEVKLCVEYGAGGAPRYESMPGWQGRTAGLRSIDELPAAARAYLARLESACGVPVTMISTGAERDETIVSRHPFG